MKISIVTLSFNQAQFLEQAIDSVIRQRESGVEVEYIVVDPGSTDGSRELIRRRRADIDHLVLDPDSGPADGLNHGFSLATGDVFGYLNADDYYLQGAFSVVSRALSPTLSQPRVLLLDGFFLDPGPMMRPVVADKFRTYTYAHDACVVFQQGSFFTRSVYDEVGGFNADNRTCWDGEFLADAHRVGALFTNLHRPVAVFRRHDTAITTMIQEAGTSMSTAYSRDRERISMAILGKNRRRGTQIVLQNASRAYRLPWYVIHSFNLRRQVPL